MERVRDEFFSRAGLAENAHTRFARRDTFHLCDEFSHRLAAKDDLSATQFLSKRCVFFLKARELDGVLDREKQLVSGYRLFKEVDGAESRGFDSHLDMRL